MAQLFDKSRVEIKLGNYGVTTAASLTDPLLHSRVQEYKRLVSGRMVPLGRDDISQKVPASDYYASRKVDGEFTVVVYQDGQAITVNPGGTVRTGLPATDEFAQLLNSAGIQQAMVVAELYVNHGGRERVHDVTRVARSPETTEDLNQLSLRVFDWLELENESITASYPEVWQRITNVFADGKLVAPVETRQLKNSDEVNSYFQEIVEDGGAEGIVLRSESAGMFKIKPRHSLDAVVIGFTESTGDRAGMLHDLLLAVRRDDGTFHVLCRVGGGFSDELRRELLADLKDEVVSSEYAEVNSDHVTYEMVEPRIVVEISCLDLISQSTRGAPINRMTLDWDAQDRIYRVLRRLPLVSVISPQFVRFRDDKTVVKEDVRIQQVATAVEVPMLDRDAKQLTLAKSEVIKREVFTKTLKGEVMVRKFILWKTNKETMSSEHPAFVVHYTDFSPNRATPLAREVRVSNSLTQAEELYDGLKEANIKKGWLSADAVADEKPLSDSAKSPPEKKTAKKATKKATRKKTESAVEMQDAEVGEAAKKPTKSKSTKSKSTKKKTATKKTPADTDDNKVTKKSAKKTAKTASKKSTKKKSD